MPLVCNNISKVLEISNIVQKNLAPLYTIFPTATWKGGSPFHMSSYLPSKWAFFCRRREELLADFKDLQGRSNGEIQPDTHTVQAKDLLVRFSLLNTKFWYELSNLESCFKVLKMILDPEPLCVWDGRI